jgi:hypothetical protein
VGVTSFLIFFFMCCGSALRSKDWAVQAGRDQVGWRTASGAIFYSERQWMLLSVSIGVVGGLATAGIGLGLQAVKRRAPLAALVAATFLAAFWITQGIFAVWPLHWIVTALLIFGVATIFVVLAGLSFASVREMAKNPPPGGEELLPLDFKEPYSHLAEDPPEVRLAKEIEQRKQRLEVEKKEVEALERRLKRKMEDKL